MTLNMIHSDQLRIVRRRKAKLESSGDVDDRRCWTVGEKKGTSVSVKGPSESGSVDVS